MSYRISAFITLLTLGSAAGARADQVTDWNLIAVQTTATLGSASNSAPRALAITHIAIHNALSAIDKTYEPYPTGSELEVTEPVSREAAVLGAAHYALSTLVPAKKAELTTKLSEALAKLPNGAAKSNGVQLGVAAAEAILSVRGTDGAILTESAYVGATDAGKWRPTGVDVNSAPVPGVDPHWRKLVPFALSAPEAFRAPAPPAIDSAAYKTDLAEVRALGNKLATEATPLTRTANQTEIAKFWEFSTHLPFNAIARQVAKREGLSLSDNARLFALLNIALADSRVAVWDSKYFHSTWRPITAIVTGDGSEEDGSTTDAAWASYLNTPAHPEYPSGHSTTGAAGAAVLKAWFGDEVLFTVASDSLPEVTRSFTTFTQAALENGRSRIYGGIHFQYANAAGQTLGRKVGEHVVATLLAPVPLEFDAGVADAGADDAGVLTDAGSDAGAIEVDAGAVEAGAEPVADASVDAGENAGEEPGEDAGAVADAGEAPSEDEESDSCAVRVGRTNPAAALPLLLAALALRVRRRRAA